MSNYPDYVHKMVMQARAEGQWYCGQADAAALCFDVLALFPDCYAAGELVYGLFCDEWLIYENRVALQRHLDEWDDRRHQQRRRLALSFRFMSCWEDKYDAKLGFEFKPPQDVGGLMEQGHHQLLEAYCLGDEEAADYAAPRFFEAIQRTSDPHAALYWVALQYADLGFFADAAEVLMELLSRFKDQGARRLLAEVRWWRDNGRRVPWLPPAGDGSRYARIMRAIDPAAPTQEELVEQVRAQLREAGNAPTWKPVIDPDVAALFGAAMPVESEFIVPTPSPVDWSFLDRDDGQPGEPADWVRKDMRRFAEHADEIYQMHRWTRQIPPPATPPRRDPNEPPFDPSEMLGTVDWEAEDDADSDDGIAQSSA
jgi:hypothetical protein